MKVVLTFIIISLLCIIFMLFRNQMVYNARQSLFKELSIKYWNDPVKWWDAYRNYHKTSYGTMMWQVTTFNWHIDNYGNVKGGKYDS